MPLNTVVALIWTPTCFAEVAVVTTMTTQMISMIMDQTEVLTHSLFFLLAIILLLYLKLYILGIKLY